MTPCIALGSARGPPIVGSYPAFEVAIFYHTGHCQWRGIRTASNCRGRGLWGIHRFLQVSCDGNFEPGFLVLFFFGGDEQPAIVLCDINILYFRAYIMIQGIIGCTPTNVPLWEIPI